MKVLTVKYKGKEISRSNPQDRIQLIGRSPNCEVVVRSRNVKPVHFLLEWVGESVPSGNGLWMLMDLSQKGREKRDIGEATVLSNAPVRMGDFEFCWLEDPLYESNLRPGGIRRSVVPLEKADLSDRSQILEVIRVNKNTELVNDIRHLDQLRKNEVLLPDFNKLKFSLSDREFLVSNDGDDVQLTSLSSQASENSHLGKGQSRRISAGELLTFANDKNIYYLRLVPKQKLKAEAMAAVKSPSLWIAVGLLLFVLVISQFVRTPEQINPTIKKIPQRFATVKINEPAPIETAKAPPPTESKVAEKSEAVVQNPTPTANLARETGTKEAAPSAPNIKPDPGHSAGLNIPAVKKNVNSIGLLGRLKSGKSSGEKLSAEHLVNRGERTETATGATGFSVAQSPVGQLGKGSGGESQGDDKGLAAAASTLKNKMPIDGKSSGTMALPGGKSQFSQGSKLGGSEDLGGGLGLNLTESHMEVAGGLDKEAIRKALSENRRAIRNCYETALLSRKDLEGRVVLRWRILPAGSVETVNIQQTSIQLPSLENCVANVVKKIVFPKSPNQLATVVIYPFVFQGRK